MTVVGGCVSRTLMKIRTFALVASVAALFLFSGDANALGLDVSCSSKDDACSPVALTPTEDGAWSVQFGDDEASNVAADSTATFGGESWGRRAKWWRWRFWRRWLPKPGPEPIDDPIAPTPDPVPEPGTLGLLGLGGAYVVTRIRKRRSA